MGDRDLPSDSDSSDDDYVPEGADKEPVSEDESANDSNEDEPVDGEEKKRKKAPSRKRSRKKLKPEDEALEKDREENKEQTEMSAEVRKKKADALWADFLKDSDPPVKKKQVKSQNEVERVEEVDEQLSKVKVVKEFHFAGEKVLVEKDVAASNGSLSPSSTNPPAVSLPARGRGRGRGGIASILGQFGKKNKLSTLEKSKLDWNMFKKNEGIEEEIEQHNRGKNGYLERQDFLERADLRQFEIEKSMRASKRSSLR